MTDDITPQAQPPPKRDEKKPASNSGSIRGPKRSVSNANAKSTGTSSQAGTRPSSRSSNKKPASNTPVAESGSDTGSKKGAENGKKPERSKSSGGNRSVHRKAPLTSQPTRNPASRDSRPSGSPAPQPVEGSAALSSLQNLIADLKTTSPNQQVAGAPITFGPTAQVASNLPVNAPVFQPGAPSYAGVGQDKHRKAASLGNSSLPPSNFNSFSPHLGTTFEEDNGAFEEGEIPERYANQPSHQARSQSQSFIPPRFAALQAQQEQADNVGPSGRPQLAPGFMFGAGGRKRTPVMGPPINEEDAGFQFPQQQSQGHPNDFPNHDIPQRKAESGEITGIMAERASSSFFLFEAFPDLCYL